MACSNGSGGLITDDFGMEEWLGAHEVVEPCSSCGGRGHVVERWTGRYWLTLRGCNVCGMSGDASEFFLENDARRRAAR